MQKALSRHCPAGKAREDTVTNGASLGSAVAYSGTASPVRWEGRVVDDRERFGRYMHDVVRPRVADEASSFDVELRGLATTGMETRFVERLLRAVPVPQGWEIGEAFAECAFRDDSDREVLWPWNTVRDRRTPRASLPGADLVGFCCDGQDVFLLFGEVKTSSDANTPPGVMSGDSGMAWQLEESATRLDIQHALLQWLYARCRSEPRYLALYQKAVKRYLESEGRALLLVGVLIRDTPPSERDLESRGKALSGRVVDPTRVDLVVWYLPVPISDWPALMRAGSP